MDLRGRLLESATEEFTEKGFLHASLRHIAQRAGCTTGAIYTQFGSKEALFDEVVHETCEGFLALIESFNAQIYGREIEEVFKESAHNTMAVLEYGYAHFHIFRLLLTGAKGTKYENLIEELVDKDYALSKDYLAFAAPEKVAGLEALKYEYKTFVRMTIQAMTMPFIDGLSFERAQIYYENANRMFLSGWQALNIF